MPPKKAPEVIEARKAARKAATKMRKARPLKRVPPPIPHGNLRIDWEAVREYYVESPEKKSVAQVATFFQISEASIKNKSSAERWPALRAQFQAELLKKRREEHVKYQVTEGIQFDQLSVNSAKLGMSLVAQRLAQIQRLSNADQARFEETMKKIHQGIPIEPSERWGSVSYREMESLARSLAMFQEVGRKALGLDTLNVDLNLSGSVDIEQTVNIGEELQKDDKDRLAAIFEVMERANLLPDNFLQDDGGNGEVTDDGIIDAEYTEDEDENDPDSTQDGLLAIEG